MAEPDPALEPLFLHEAVMTEAVYREYRFGQVALFSTPAPDKQTCNEDSAMVVPVDEQRGILAIADGVGGQPAGHQASSTALATLAESIRSSVEGGLDEGGMREAILAGFDLANRAVIQLGTGAMTTLAVVEIAGRTLRTYHVGDTEVLLFGKRGKMKLQTISHSPVAYAVEAGLLNEKEAMVHEDRHLVSNVLGDESMRVEMSSTVELSAQDTLVAASDGLTDNLRAAEIVEKMRLGPLPKAVRVLVEECQKRMRSPAEGRPSKPDDLTLLAYRPPRT